mgnify:CR=1 FL=1
MLPHTSISKVCSVPGCDRQSRARGLCKAHWKRWRTHGDILADVPVKTQDSELLFWERVDKEGPDGCWLWKGRTNRYGYGLFQGRHEPSTLAHRIAYIRCNGPIPEGLVLDHLCRNPMCVNPAHLEPVTQGVNIQRGNAGQKAADRQHEKTHCPQGHPYDLLNTYFKGKRRVCIACRRESDRRRYREAKGI